MSIQKNFKKIFYASGTTSRIRGFTLVELLVASSIFSSVLIIAVGALFSAQAINSKLQETQIILDGVNLATELMGRDIRYGSDFHCESLPFNDVNSTSSRRSCVFPDGGTALVFRPGNRLVGSTDPVQDRVMYHVEEITINNKQVSVIYKDEFPYGTTSKKYQITPTDVSIETLSFYVSGANSSTGVIDVAGVSDFNQPLITYTVSGVTIPSRANREAVKFDLQSSAVPRGIDN